MSPRKTPIQVRTGKASSVIISFRFFLKFKFFFFLFRAIIIYSFIKFSIQWVSPSRCLPGKKKLFFILNVDFFLNNNQ
jgi:hypothetical protein